MNKSTQTAKTGDPCKWGSPENLKWMEDHCDKSGLPTMDQLPGWSAWVDSIRRRTHEFERKVRGL